MRKTEKIILSLLGWILLFAILGCDPGIDYDYYIINNCGEEIEVYLLDIHNKSFAYTIDVDVEKFVYHNAGINYLEDRMIEFWVKELTITKDDKISKINYIDKNLWFFEPTSKYHANSYLTIEPKDFE